MYNQVHQEQIAAGETTEDTAKIPVVQEQVIVQDIPDVVVPLPPVEEFTEPVCSSVHHEQIVTGEMTQDIIGISAVQDQVIVQELPPIVEQTQETIDVTPQRSQIAPKYELHVDQST